jgi:hypothetical protein
LACNLIFAAQNLTMDYRQAEYHEELQKVQDRDFTHNWVSSSAFIFYLSVFCFLAFSFGSCFKLYTKRFENSAPQNVQVQESTLYTPKYSVPAAK